MLTTDSVFDDSDAETLTGSGGMEWYFANTTGTGTLDAITDLKAAEVVTEL